MSLQPDFAGKFCNLTRGMDEQSISTLIRILLKQQAIVECNKRIFNLYTKDERRELRELKDNFYDQILQLSDNLFAYKNYLLPIKRFAPSIHYYKYGTKDVETIGRVRGKTVIDAGGYIGDAVLVFEELSPEKIYVFEPSPDNFELLKKTLEINGLKNVVAENVAVGAEKGECTLFMDNGDGAATGIVKKLHTPYRKEIKVPLISLDDYVTEHKIDNIGLIKADVEGAEPDFLTGAKKTIFEQKPILLICIYHNPHDFFEIKPMIESWNLGYKFKIHKPTHRSIVTETVLIAEVI